NMESSDPAVNAHRVPIVAGLIMAIAIAGCSSSHSSTSSTTTTSQPAASTTSQPGAPGKTTTTTTAPPATSSPAVSATFVSAGDGDALEQSGRIDATTDGGTSWKIAGSRRVDAPALLDD